MIEKNLDGLHEARLGGIMERGGSPAICPLPGQSLVLDARVVAQQSRDELGVIFSSLVSGAREPYPRPRSVDACPRALKHRRKLRMKDPAARAN